MSDDRPRTALQNMRSRIISFFPWIAHVVEVKGKGLAIRTASGLLHLAGGPDDPAVHRVGDAGVGGSWTIQMFGAGNPPPTPSNQVTITYVAPDGTPQILTITGLTVAMNDGPYTINFATKATTGSGKVTCG